MRGPRLACQRLMECSCARDAGCKYAGKATDLHADENASSLLWSAHITSEIDNRQPSCSLCQDFALRTMCCCARRAARVPPALQAALATHTAAMLFCWDGEATSAMHSYHASIAEMGVGGAQGWYQPLWMPGRPALQSEVPQSLSSHNSCWLQMMMRTGDRGMAMSAVDCKRLDHGH